MKLKKSFTTGIAVLLLSAVFVSSQNQSGESSHGSCQQAGYTECCNQPDNGCEVKGDCFCNIECHEYDDCCSDINQTCPNSVDVPASVPMQGSCVQSGYTECCNLPGDGCQVNGSCFCNVQCFQFNDCCSDINQTCSLQVFESGNSTSLALVISLGVLTFIIVCFVMAILMAVSVICVRKRKEDLHHVNATELIVRSGVDNANYMGFDTTVNAHATMQQNYLQSTIYSNSEDVTNSPPIPFPASMSFRKPIARDFAEEKDPCLSELQDDSYSEPIDTIGFESDEVRSVEIFWPPAAQERELRQQCAQLGLLEIPMKSLSICEQIGRGEFGTVHRGVWHHSSNSNEQPSEDEEVAVKSMKSGASEEERVKFLQEAAIMGQFGNPHILNILGMVTTSLDNKLRIVADLMHRGDLHTHLITLRPDCRHPVPAELGPTLLSYSRQVASGLMYLSIKKYIHRDLAARNVLVSSDGMCKIADFGLSRDLQDEDYYTSHGGKIPVKWTAPEALLYRVYSTASDIWSYGCLLYEIWSLGNKPYEDCSSTEVLQKLQAGYRLPPPPGCPRNIYQLMIKCWHPHPSSRPVPGLVVAQLSHPDFQILRRSVVNNNNKDQARILGAPLIAGYSLFKDLQATYSEKDCTPQNKQCQHHSSRPESVVSNQTPRGYGNNLENNCMPATQGKHIHKTDCEKQPSHVRERACHNKNCATCLLSSAEVTHSYSVLEQVYTDKQNA